MRLNVAWCGVFVCVCAERGMRAYVVVVVVVVVGASAGAGAGAGAWIQFSCA